MGCVMSAEEKAQQQMSRRIDDELAYEMAHRRSEVKLLLLGKKREGPGIRGLLLAQVTLQTFQLSIY